MSGVADTNESGSLVKKARLTLLWFSGFGSLRLDLFDRGATSNLKRSLIGTITFFFRSLFRFCSHSGKAIEVLVEEQSDELLGACTLVFED